MKTTIFHIALILALAVPLAAQESQVFLCGQSSNGFRGSAVFGILPGATFCEDVALGEVNDPGPPPDPWEPVFRWIYPAGTNPGEGGMCFGYGRLAGPDNPPADYRAYVDRLQSDTFRIYFQPDGIGSGFPFRISWTDDIDTHFDSVRLDYLGDSGAVTVDMAADSTHTITDPTVSSFRIVTWGVFGTVPAPIAPVLDLPADHAVDLPLTVQFTWIPIRRAISYELQVSADPSFQDAVHDDTVLCPKATAGRFRMGTLYHWRVRSLGIHGASDWSAVRSFTTSVPNMLGWGTAAVDGLLDSVEYASAAVKDITITLPGGTTIPGRIYIMNDDVNIYFGLRHEHIDEAAMVRLSVAFQKDLEIHSVGDDIVSLQSGLFLTTDFNDYYRTDEPPCPPGTLCAFTDTASGGTLDGGAALTTSPCGCDMYEIAHPLWGADADHDIQIAAGDPQGFLMSLRIFIGSHYADTQNHDEFTVAQSRLSVDVEPRWNLLSLPVQGNGHLRSAVFPTATTQAFFFNNGGTGYTANDTITHGGGFWLRFPAARKIGLFGETVKEETVSVTAGWNIIGSVDMPIPVTSITSDPPGLVTSPFYGYDGGYFIAAAVEPGKAYWMKVSKPGTLFLSIGPQKTAIDGIRIRDAGESPPPPPGAGPAPGAAPASCRLYQNYPNPFNPGTSIGFELNEGSFVTLRIFNVAGEEVTTLVNGMMPAGPHTVRWDAAGLPSGVYYFDLKAGSFTEMKKMVLLK